MNYSCIVVAAGSGSRTGLSYNKMFYKLNNKTVIENSLNLFIEDEECKQIVLVINEKEEGLFKDLKLSEKVSLAYGGQERKDSVYNGLNLVSEDYVMIHDGARPYLKKDCLEKIKKTLQKYDATLLMVPSIDTSKQVIDGFVKRTLVRDEVYNAQTPQAFKTELIKKCYEQLLKDGVLVTDDVQVVEYYSDDPIKVIEGDYSNIKITTESDLLK